MADESPATKADIQTVNQRIDVLIGLVTNLSRVVEQSASALSDRMTALEARMGTLELRMTRLENRMDSLEGRIAKLEEPAY